jgi:Recombinase zinc beta ribbon domain
LIACPLEGLSGPQQMAASPDNSGSGVSRDRPPICTGKPRYLLSGLLRCGVCDAHYTITNATSYGCSSYHDGHACSNSILVGRDRVENILLGPIRDDLLKPDRVVWMAKEMQDYFADRWFGGKIRLEPLADGGLMAHWNQNIGALVSAAVGTFGSGGPLRALQQLRP